MPAIEYLAFDADDTLWHNERLYAETQKQFTQLLSHYHDPEWVHERLYQTEMQNIKHFGYGIKAFALSLVETAIELTEERITSREIQEIVGWAKRMINADVQLLPNVSDVVSQLSNQYPLMIITKGDLLDQETKVERSGLREYFRHIEVVSHKTVNSYEKLLKRYAITPDNFVMIGNSLPSDILPVLQLGGKAVHVPYELTWQHEMAEPPKNHAGFYQLEHIGQLPHLLEEITRASI